MTKTDHGATLETARLWLRPMQENDLDSLLRVFTDPRVMAAFDAEPFDRVQMRQWLRRNLEHQDKHGFGLFSLILKESNELIGDCGLETTEIDGGPVTELGYDLRSEVWGQGLATEAAIAVRDYALHQLGMARLVSLIRQGNTPSRRVAEKVGMRYERDIGETVRRYWLYGVKVSEANLI